ncbi:recombinase family protein [Leptospira sp. 96542]|nr:recombinase family protein [Leptospira sp. 96542]
MPTTRIAYYRVSTLDQSIESQRNALRRDLGMGEGEDFAFSFADEGVSGAVPAAHRPKFAAMLQKVRAGDTVCVYSVDRLGRDAIDVQTTVRALIDQGVTVYVRGLGNIGKGVGELILAVLSQVADMERQRIRERTEAGRQLARETLARTGKTHRDKASMGAPFAAQAKAGTTPEAIVEWRSVNNASIADTAEKFGISIATVKRYTAQAKGQPAAVGA